jgi:phosphoribosylformylglycinamidine synthase
MPNYRLLVEKKSEYASEARALSTELAQILNFQGTQVRIINVYDINQITESELNASKWVVFDDPVADTEHDNLVLPPGSYFAVRPLAGQYDQRADSALQALNLLNINSPELSVTTAKIIIFDPCPSSQQLETIIKYYVNPIENEIFELAAPTVAARVSDDNSPPIFVNFTQLDEGGLKRFKQEQSLAMSFADLALVQQYFCETEKRDPSQTEIKVLDTYWSDHCRHTTFETHLTSITFAPGQLQPLFKQALADYEQMRQQVHGHQLPHKPITLMDLATINAKYLRQAGKLTDVEVTDEINACSLVTEIEVNQQKETWSIQFKNETHNHPTEIEPFGGAATCIGGAIRDPLSGRAYVYQAVRVSGAANVLEPISATLAGKLPQRFITSKAAQGFSSYGNQIGLATTLVKEYYHPGYQAKRMEVGMVVAAAPYANIVRQQPRAGDLIVMIGGATGRDGCGGATGSSQAHTQQSATQCYAEVQKGNPVVERKLQRLFRNPQFSRLIKKCNDFGAGGIAVAIGELAAGVIIDLDQVPLKYQGLTATELAISESQERMAVVINAQDYALVQQLADSENLAAVAVATVTDAAQLVMLYRGKPIVSLNREFLNTNGAQNMAHCAVAQPNLNDLHNFWVKPKNDWPVQLKHQLSKLTHASTRGLSDMFDATIGATTILMPYGGKHQRTPTQVSAQKIPVLNGETDWATLASCGFDPYLSEISPFHGGYFAVIDAVAKLVAAGGDMANIRLSLQEYFERLHEPSQWGKPLAALLGASSAMRGLELGAIGGKDSMSGSFNQLTVPPTLIAFALAPGLASQVISPEFKTGSEYIYAYLPQLDTNYLLNLSELTQVYTQIHQLIINKQVSAAFAIDSGGIAKALFLMAIGNNWGVNLEFSGSIDLTSPVYGGLIVSSNQPLKLAQLICLGTTQKQAVISQAAHTVSLAELYAIYTQPLVAIFPLTAASEESSAAPENNLGLSSPTASNKPTKIYTGAKLAQPRVIIPVFPGTNCEYESASQFKKNGALCNTLVFRNRTPTQVSESIEQLATAIETAQILMLAGGFSAGDEPAGSAKFIAAVLRNERIAAAINQLLSRDGLILGICNGFQALIKSGLLPYGAITKLTANDATLSYNQIGRHISRIVPTRITNNHSPWLSSFACGTQHYVAMSHGEGRFMVSQEMYHQLAARGQIATQYADLTGKPTLDQYFNPNGSSYAIEGITSEDGRIFGKMGHSERYGTNLYKNIPEVNFQDVFSNGVGYFN